MPNYSKEFVQSVRDKLREKSTNKAALARKLGKNSQNLYPFMRGGNIANEIFVQILNELNMADVAHINDDQKSSSTGVEPGMADQPNLLRVRVRTSAFSSMAQQPQVSEAQSKKYREFEIWDYEIPIIEARRIHDKEDEFAFLRRANAELESGLARLSARKYKYLHRRISDHLHALQVTMKDIDAARPKSPLATPYASGVKKKPN